MIIPVSWMAPLMEACGLREMTPEEKRVYKAEQERLKVMDMVAEHTH